MYYIIAITYPDSSTDQFHIEETEIIQFLQFLTKNVDFEAFTLFANNRSVKRTYKEV